MFYLIVINGMNSIDKIVLAMYVIVYREYINVCFEIFLINSIMVCV